MGGGDIHLGDGLQTLSRSLAFRTGSGSESASIASSTVRTIDERLDEIFLKNRTERFTDADVQQISFLLQNSERSSSGRVPRIYTVLRIIDRLELLGDFTKLDITDLSFPFTAASLPSSIELDIRAQFLSSQSFVLTKTLDLEKGERGAHQHFGKGETVPYEVKGRLGAGGYGEVEKVISLLSHLEYARKKVRRIKNSANSQQQIKDFLGELRVLKRISHIHCVKLVGSYTDPKYFALLMSPVADCNLAQYMTEALDSKDKQSLLRSFFGCLNSGLQYLHDLKIRHRDVKPENILVRGANALWTDFGISLDWDGLSRSTTTADSAKSPIYCAPEVAKFEPRNSSSDVWSLGCVFLEMTTVLKGQTIPQMRRTFKEFSDNHRYYANLKPTNIWMDSLHDIGSELDNAPLEWIRLMLNESPKSRPTAEILQCLITEQHSITTSGGIIADFCGTCCADLDESPVVSDSDGDAWIEEPEEDKTSLQSRDLASTKDQSAAGGLEVRVKFDERVPKSVSEASVSSEKAAIASDRGVSIPISGVDQDTLVTVKVNIDGQKSRFKLPLHDMSPQVFTDKLRLKLEIPQTSHAVFERYSDSADAYIVLDRNNASSYKQLYRAARAKLYIRVKVTIISQEKLQSIRSDQPWSDQFEGVIQSLTRKAEKGFSSARKALQ